MPLPTNLLPVNMAREEYAVSRYHLDVPPGVTLSDVRDPDFWVHLAARLRLNDVISAVSMDGSFDAELRVIAKDPRNLWAQMRLLRWCSGHGVAIESGTVEDTRPPSVAQWPDPEGYTVEFSRAHKWRIIDRANNLVARDFPDELAAIEALGNIKAAKKAA